MKTLMSSLLTAALAATSIAPALAGPHDHGGQGGGRPAAAPAVAPPQARGGDAHADRAMRAVEPQRMMQPRFENRPPRVEPQRMLQPRFENRPARVEPQRMMQPRFENRPPRIEPQRVMEPRFENRPARVEPQRVMEPRFENRARFENRPVQFENRPARFAAPFEQRVRHDREDRDDNQAPFAQIVRPHRERFEARNAAFVAGRVVDVDNDDLFLENPAGQTIVVRGWHGRGKHLGWFNHAVTVPVVFQNGAYYAVGTPIAPAAFTSFVVPTNDLLLPAATYVPTYVTNYAYSPAYEYVPAYSYTPDYTNYAVASTISSLLSNVLGSNKGSLANSLLSNYLASYALGSLSGYSPAVQSYAYPSATYVSPLTYAYPTTCVYNDPNDGTSYYDPSCAPATTTTYYTSASAYAPAQIQGVVVGTSGSTLMVLGSNGMSPVLVNDAPALQNGTLFNGQPAVGRLISASGFYDGNTFVATALQ